jgi:hypothetical protein
VTCDPPPNKPPCTKTNTCDKPPCKATTRICEKGGDGGGGGGDGDPCKTHRCQPKPPPPPVCDAVCQNQKKSKKERDQLEQDAKTIQQPPPGNPVCASGNPLCPTGPAQPATVVTSGGDLTNETTAWSDQQYKNALNQYGSVISSVSTTGSYNWFTGIQICDSADCDSADCGGEPGEPQIGGGGVGEGGGGEGTGSEGGPGEGTVGEVEAGAMSSDRGCGCTPQVGETAPAPGQEFLAGQGDLDVPFGPATEDAWTALNRVDEKGSPLPGYKGGKTFLNNGSQGASELPRTAPDGGSITYREWDLSPNVKGVPRDGSRLVTGSDGSAYYTTDHYVNFVRFR